MLMKGINWFIGKASIRKKLIISFSVLVSISVIALGVFSFKQSETNSEKQIRSTMDSNLSLLISELNYKITSETDNTKYLAYNVNFRKSLEIAEKDPLRLTQELNNNVEPNFWYFLTSNTFIKEINVYSPHVHKPVGSFIKPYTDSSEPIWLREGKMSTVWEKEGDQLYAMRNILDVDTTSKVIGVMRIDYYTDFIMSTLGKTDYLNNGVIIADSNDRILYTKSSQSEEINRLVQDFIKGKSSRKVLNDKALFTQGTLVVPDWNIYYFIDRSHINQLLMPIIKTTLIVVGVCLFVSFIMISLLSNLLSRRILKLKVSAEQVASGNFDVLNTTNDADEIAVVSNSLVYMANQIKGMIDQIYKMEIEKKDIEIQALQAMINPHFLYNALSSIKWRAIYSEDEKVAEGVTWLAKFYRTSLNNGKAVTTVQKELENIRAYLEVQQMLHDKTFQTTFEIDNQTEERMLNFILQPIVENAIIHGIVYASEEEQGRLIVRYYIEGEHLIFEILNNGPQFDVGLLDEIRNKQGKGYGIYNIQKRIDLYYGVGSGINVWITPEGYTNFVVKIKRIKKDSI